MTAFLVHQFLEASAQRRPESLFLVHEDARASYGEVEAGANRIARALRGLGASRGDRVALLAHNGRAYVEAYYGILKVGAIAVPLNTAADGATLSRLLVGCTAKLCIAGPRLEKVGAAACAAAPGAELIAPARLADACAAESSEPLGLAQPDSDVASIIYTSGSTGVPQGATLSHHALATNTRSIVAYLELTAEDRVLSLLPFYYVYGKSLLNTHACAGGSLAIENRFLYPNVALDTLEKESCTGLSGVPSTFAILLNRTNFAERALPSLRYVTQAGGAMSPELVRRLAAAVRGRKVFIMYGATEAGARLSYLPPERLADKPGSIGIAIPNVELRVLGPDGRELPPRETGELVARGANLMSGYWGDPESTARALDGNGYHTGDLAWRDEEGFFYIAGRIKDIIKAGAHRISAKEIEDAIAMLPEVHEAAVIGVPDEVLGEKIKAFVVLREGVALGPAAIEKALRQKLPAYKLPGEYAIVPDLPKNESGKIMKRALAESGERSMSSPPSLDGDLDRVVPPPPPAALSTGARVAGAVLILNALLAATQALTIGWPGPARLQPITAVAPLMALVDFAIGATLLAGQSGVLGFARFRIAMGLLVLPPYLYFAFGAPMAIVQTLFSAGMAALLFGRPGQIRLALGLVAVSICLVVGLSGELALATGYNPVGRLFAAADLEREVAVLEGADFPYHVTAPAGWYLRKPSASGPHPDRWLTQANYDAHVMVIAERLPPDSRLDLERYAKAVVDNMRLATTELEVLDSGPLANPNGDGLLVHLRANASGLALEYFIGLYSRGDAAYRLVGFAPVRAAPRVRDELLAILSSLDSSPSAPSI